MGLPLGQGGGENSYQPRLDSPPICSSKLLQPWGCGGGTCTGTLLLCMGQKPRWDNRDNEWLCWYCGLWRVRRGESVKKTVLHFYNKWWCHIVQFFYVRNLTTLRVVRFNTIYFGQYVFTDSNVDSLELLSCKFSYNSPSCKLLSWYEQYLICKR